jgi:hypothetical protein
MGSLRFFGIVAAILAPTIASGTPLLNGNFETGDLTGWSEFRTENGLLWGGRFSESHPHIVLFDVDGDGVESYSVELNVGTMSPGDWEGGGIRQEVLLQGGDLHILADIAMHPPDSDNADGGLVELLFDGITVDQHDFGDVGQGFTERASLDASLTVASSGLFEIAIRVTRPWGTNASDLKPIRTPFQYIDNVRLSGTAVPEPSAGTLLGLGLLLMAGWYRQRTGSRAGWTP